MSKYHNKKVTVDNYVFDSIAESKRYKELCLLEKANKIKSLELQPKFELQEAFIKNGKRYKAITYTADFMYLDVEKNCIVVEDVKGFETKEFKLKQKMFEHKYKNLSLVLIK